jgi:hypothetical protein
MIRPCIIVTLIAGLAACSSTEESKTPAPTSSGGSSGTSGSSGSSGSSGETSSGAPAATLKAPKISSVGKMMGALHVMWTNQDTTCESVVGERKAEMASGMVHEEFKEVFTVPGEADNKHDTSATDDMTYTYRLRCKKGTAFSDFSNTMSGNPTK